MFPVTDHFASASKAFFESRLAAFGALTNIALQGAEKIVALNMAVAKASTDESAITAKVLFEAKNPQDFISLVTAHAKPNVDKVAAYGRDLTDIVSATKVEFAKVAEAQVTDAQNQVSAWVDGITKNAPIGSESAGALLKSAMASAHDGYQQLNSATKKAVEAAETHVANASGQFAQAAKKAAK
jgi:phasin family protein